MRPSTSSDEVKSEKKKRIRLEGKKIGGGVQERWRNRAVGGKL